MLYLLNFVEFLFAKSVAYLLKTFGNIRRKIADKNLEVCFPELSQLERSKILNKHFLTLELQFFMVLKLGFLAIKVLRGF